MTEEQEKHLDNIKIEFLHLVDAKYRAGQKSHGGDLFLMSTVRLIDNAIDEAIDQFVYLTTLKERFKHER